MPKTALTFGTSQWAALGESVIPETVRTTIGQQRTPRQHIIGNGLLLVIALHGLEDLAEDHANNEDYFQSTACEIITKLQELGGHIKYETLTFKEGLLTMICMEDKHIPEDDKWTTTSARQLVWFMDEVITWMAINSHYEVSVRMSAGYGRLCMDIYTVENDTKFLCRGRPTVRTIAALDECSAQLLLDKGVASMFDDAGLRHAKLEVPTSSSNPIYEVVMTESDFAADLYRIRESLDIGSGISPTDSLLSFYGSALMINRMQTKKSEVAKRTTVSKEMFRTDGSLLYALPEDKKKMISQLMPEEFCKQGIDFNHCLEEDVTTVWLTISGCDPYYRTIAKIFRCVSGTVHNCGGRLHSMSDSVDRITFMVTFTNAVKGVGAYDRSLLFAIKIKEIGLRDGVQTAMGLSQGTIRYVSVGTPRTMMHIMPVGQKVEYARALMYHALDIASYAGEELDSEDHIALTDRAVSSSYDESISSFSLGKRTIKSPKRTRSWDMELYQIKVEKYVLPPCPKVIANNLPLGRNVEIKAVKDGLSAGNVCLLRGPSGSGKTYLASCIGHSYKKEVNAMLVSAHTTRVRQLEYMHPWRRVFDSLLKSLVTSKNVDRVLNRLIGDSVYDEFHFLLKRVAPWLPILYKKATNNGQFHTVAPEIQNSMLNEIIAKIMETYAKECGLCIIFDDFQWYDTHSKELILKIIRNETPRLHIILTGNTSDPTDAEVLDNFRTLIGNRCKIVEVGNFKSIDYVYQTLERAMVLNLPQDTVTVAASVLSRDHPPTVQYVQQVFTTTEGQVAMIHELGAKAARDGRVSVLGDLLHVGGCGMDAGNVMNMDELVMSRFLLMSDMTQNMMQYAALMGRIWDHELLVNMVERESFQKKRTIVNGQLMLEAIINRIVVPDPSVPDIYEFIHVSVPTAIQNSMSDEDKKVKYAELYETLKSDIDSGNRTRDECTYQLLNLFTGNMNNSLSPRREFLWRYGLYCMANHEFNIVCIIFGELFNSMVSVMGVHAKRRRGRAKVGELSEQGPFTLRPTDWLELCAKLVYSISIVHGGNCDKLDVEDIVLNSGHFTKWTTKPTYLGVAYRYTLVKYALTSIHKRRYRIASVSKGGGERRSDSVMDEEQQLHVFYNVLLSIAYAKVCRSRRMQGYKQVSTMIAFELVMLYNATDSHLIKIGLAPHIACMLTWMGYTARADSCMSTQYFKELAMLATSKSSSSDVVLFANEALSNSLCYVATRSDKYSIKEVIDSYKLVTSIIIDKCMSFYATSQLNHTLLLLALYGTQFLPARSARDVARSLRHSIDANAWQNVVGALAGCCALSLLGEPVPEQIQGKRLMEIAVQVHDHLSTQSRFSNDVPCTFYSNTMVAAMHMEVCVRGNIKNSAAIALAMSLGPPLTLKDNMAAFDTTIISCLWLETIWEIYEYALIDHQKKRDLMSQIVKVIQCMAANEHPNQLSVLVASQNRYNAARLNRDTEALKEARAEAWKAQVVFVYINASLHMARLAPAVQEGKAVLEETLHEVEGLPLSGYAKVRFLQLGSRLSPL